MSQTFVVPGRFPSLNDWTRISKNPKARAALKKDCDQRVADCAGFFAIQPVTSPIRYHVTWVEPDRARDLDNIAFGKKFIQDGLVKAGIIPNDRPANIIGFSDSFDYDRENPRIIITIQEVSIERDEPLRADGRADGTQEARGRGSEGS